MGDSSAVDSIQEIAYKLMLEQNKNDKILNGTKNIEKTIFVLGSPSCVRQFLNSSLFADVKLIFLKIFSLCRANQP